MHAEEFDDARLVAWVQRVEDWWVAVGVRPPERARLLSELTDDLRQALRDGATVKDLVAEHPADFARTVASASQVAHSVRFWRPAWRFTPGRLVAVLTAGAAVGFALSLFLVYPMASRLFAQGWMTPEREAPVALALHALTAAVCLACAVAAASSTFPREVGDRRTVVALAAGLLGSGAVSIWPTMRFARAFDYATAAPVVLTEVALEVGCCSLGVLAAWRLLGRRRRPVLLAA